ncbi:putative hydrolase [Phytophthora cinnamomi]|uniref:putative hydrolase n=1 Tax=Phytophthora cinnamomi TaxID=4785 RepID=UPI003559FC7D|nr:putative hydrolase [Phytophthora cinnamomi]
MHGSRQCRRIHRRLAHELRLGRLQDASQVVRQRRPPVDHLPISDVTSIPSTIQFKYDYDGGLIANVAYDLFTSSTADGDAEYEIMVWLATIGGAGPLSNTGSAVAQVAVGGVDFELYHGKNGNITVYSFVAPTIVNSYSTDLKQFFDNLPANLTIAPTQYLINVQAGTEPFVGNGTLTVSKYSAAVKTAEYSQIQQQ